jgi:hypothetical protein
VAERPVKSPFISDEQITAFVDVNGRIHVYRGAGIIGTNRLEGTERAAALDAIRRAVDADYATEVARLPHAHPFVPGREVYEVCETCTFDRSHRWHDLPFINPEDFTHPPSARPPMPADKPNRRDEWVESMVRYAKKHKRWDELSPEEAVRAILEVAVGDIGAAQSFVYAIGLDVDLYA